MWTYVAPSESLGFWVGGKFSFKLLNNGEVIEEKSISMNILAEALSKSDPVLLYLTRF
jgi:hypothetical protein